MSNSCITLCRWLASCCPQASCSTAEAYMCSAHVVGYNVRSSSQRGCAHQCVSLAIRRLLAQLQGSQAGACRNAARDQQRISGHCACSHGRTWPAPTSAAASKLLSPSEATHVHGDCLQLASGTVLSLLGAQAALQKIVAIWHVQAVITAACGTCGCPGSHVSPLEGGTICQPWSCLGGAQPL